MIRDSITIGILCRYRCATIVRIKRIVETVTICVITCGCYIGKAVAIGIIAFDRIVNTVAIRVEVEVIRDSITIGVTDILVTVENAITI